MPASSGTAPRCPAGSPARAWNRTSSAAASAGRLPGAAKLGECQRSESILQCRPNGREPREIEGGPRYAPCKRESEPIAERTVTDRPEQDEAAENRVPRPLFTPRGGVVARRVRRSRPRLNDGAPKLSLIGRPATARRDQGQRDRLVEATPALEPASAGRSGPKHRSYRLPGGGNDLSRRRLDLGLAQRPVG